MKRLKFLLFIILFFISSVDVSAESQPPIEPDQRFAGVNRNNTFSLGSKQSQTGQFYYADYQNSTGDYLMVSYCATGSLGNWVADNSYMSLEPIVIPTGINCNAGNGYRGFLYLNYYLVNHYSYNSQYNLNEILINSSTFYNNNDFYVFGYFNGITTSTSLDMSMSILAYLQSNESQIDYTSALNRIQENQYLYRNDISSIKDNVESGFNNLTNGLDDLNENITSSDITESENEASSFFDGFDVTDNGGISSIVTSPLVAIEKMVSGTCSPLTTTYKGKTITLPCGNSFWADMPDVQNFLNIVLGGFLCYGILAKLYLLIDRLKNPEDDRVEVMKL